MAQDELPPSLDEVGELDSYWNEETTITVSRYTKARLDAHRDGKPWDQYLEQLRREHADPMTLTSVDEIAERLNKQLTVTLDATERHEIAQDVAEVLQR